MLREPDPAHMAAKQGPYFLCGLDEYPNGSTTTGQTSPHFWIRGVGEEIGSSPELLKGFHCNHCKLIHWRSQKHLLSGRTSSCSQEYLWHQPASPYVGTCITLPFQNLALFPLSFSHRVFGLGQMLCICCKPSGLLPSPGSLGTPGS